MERPFSSPSRPSGLGPPQHTLPISHPSPTPAHSQPLSLAGRLLPWLMVVTSCTAAFLLSCPPQGHHPCFQSMRGSSLAGRRTEPQSLHHGPWHRSQAMPKIWECSSISSHTHLQLCCYGCTMQNPLTRTAPSAAHGWTGKSPCIQNPAFRLLHPTQPNNKPLNWSPGDLHTLCIDTNKLRRWKATEEQVLWAQILSSWSLLRTDVKAAYSCAHSSFEALPLSQPKLCHLALSLPCKVCSSLQHFVPLQSSRLFPSLPRNLN